MSKLTAKPSFQLGGQKLDITALHLGPDAQTLAVMGMQ